MNWLAEFAFIKRFWHAKRQIVVRVRRCGKCRLKMVNSVLEQDARSAPAANANGLMVISYLQLRFYVGLIGVLLPWLLVIGNWAVGQGLQPSLSRSSRAA